jgi:RNA polymerase sigma factor (sigma-70 family)
MNQENLYIQFAEIYSKIEPMLSYRATRFTSEDHTPEDLKQIMMVSIWEKALNDPSFLEESPSYIATFGGWMAGNAVSKEKTYRKHVVSVGEENESDEDFLFEFVDLTGNPEDLIVRKEIFAELYADMRDVLTEDSQRIVLKLMSGFKAVEIAEETGVSRAAVSKRMKNVRKAVTKPERFVRRRITTHQSMKFAGNWKTPDQQTQKAIDASKANAVMY